MSGNDEYRDSVGLTLKAWEPSEDFAVQWVRSVSIEIRKLRAMKAAIEKVVYSIPSTETSPYAITLKAAIHAYAVAE